MRETPGAGQRAVFYQQLHRTYERHGFDNWLVWGGNAFIEIDGARSRSTLARAYVGPGKVPARAKVRCELFVAAAEALRVRRGDVDARLWTDANGRGFVDAAGTHQNDPGRYLPMHLVCDPEGVPVLAGQNLVFESEEFLLERTGVFSYTVEFSADSGPAEHREWISLNDLANNRDGVIVVSPDWVRQCPVIAEVCARKVGAWIEGGKFHSGKLREVTCRLEQVPAEVIYLLPFFKPGFADLHTGQDVRKGTLGSVYAVQDFFQMDPELISPPEEIDLGELVRQGLIREQDLESLTLEELARLSGAEAGRRLGRQNLIQLIGLAELRALTRQAHALGKKVIFDLVLMQTSRDNPLIREHPEWYVLDEQGRPKVHQIAWLVYSDVALFDLVFNYPLQNYLLGVAPYWIDQGDLDGVRLDASQTVDRPFLKKIKNRINELRPQALVLGETLCPLDQALDVPVDMVYALMVDFHREVEQAGPLIRFLEEMHGKFAPQTVAMAYFENHDSPRATRVWCEKYANLLTGSARARAYWQGLECRFLAGGENRPLLMALLKNLQATLINASAGSALGSNLAYGLELGSEWGERERTDFENQTLLNFAWRDQEPHAALARAYERLHALLKHWSELRQGHVYYHRSEFAGGDPEDRVFAYARYTSQGALLLVHNFDPVQPRAVRCDFAYLPFQARRAELLFDTYAELGIEPVNGPGNRISGPDFCFCSLPLQTRLWRLWPS
jgi:glycosidase